jgi:hypothetical protein
MEQLKAQLNTWLDSIGRENLIKYVAGWFVFYALLVGVGSGCLAIAGLISTGGMAAGAAALGASGASSEASREIAEATAQLGAATGWLWVLAALSAVSGVLHIAAAVGLFQRKAWGRQATIIALGLGIASGLLNFSGGGIVWLIIEGILLYIFLTDEGVKAILSN